MTDGRTTEDEALDSRLRAGFQALEAEVGASPRPVNAAEATTSHPAPPVGRRPRLLAAAIVVVVLAGGAVVAWQVADDDAAERVATAPTDGTGGTGSSTATGGDVQDLPLEGTRWWLVTAEDDGQVVDLGDEEQIGLQLDADVPCASLSDQLDCETLPVLRASDACNGVARQYSIDGDTIEVGRQVAPSTLRACGGALVQLLGRVYHLDPDQLDAPTQVTFEIRGDSLTIRRGTATLVYRASAGPFAPTAGTVVDEGEVDSRSYRLTWKDGGLQLQDADTETGAGRGGTGVYEDPGRINVMRSEVGGRAYLMAVVPAETARAVYEPVGGEPVEVPTIDVGSDRSKAIGTFVDEAPATWHLVVYDADGLELHRVRWGDAPEGGSGRSLEEVVAVAGFDECCGQTGARATFTVDGASMSISLSPLEPTAPRDPLVGIEGARYLPDGAAVVGSVRGQAAIRFDCAGRRYDVWADPDQGDRLPDVAAALSAAAGCDVLAVGGG